MAISNGVKKPKAFRSLTVTLAISFLALASIILIVFGAIEVYFDFRTHQKVLANQGQLIAHEAARTVSSFIQEKFSLLRTTASIGKLATVSQKEQEIVLEELVGKEPSFRQLVLLNAQEEEQVRVSRLSKILAVQLMKYDRRALFSKVSQKETYISPVYIDEITSEPMIVIAIPTTDVFGDFKGTLMADVNLKFMWDLVAGIKIGEQGLAYVVDRQGNLIAFSDISRVLRGENLLYLTEVTEFVNSEGVSDIRAAILSKGIQGNYVVATYAPLETPDWAVIVELPIFEAYQNLIFGFEVSALMTFFSLVLVIVVGIYLSRGITKPIISLRDAAIEIGKGNLEKEIQVETKDEIGELALAFSQMTSDLKRSRKELEEYGKTLEEKIKERTKELDKALGEMSGKNIELEEREGAMMNLIEDARILEGHLKEERDRVKAIIVSMGEGLLVVDRQNKILLINPAAEKLLGMSQDKIRDQDIIKTIPLYSGGNLVTLEDHPVAKAVKTGKVIVTTLGENLYLQTVSGSKFAVVMVVTPLLGEGISGAVMMFRDASEEKQLDEAKTGFISIASHQLRTPLTSMRWFSEMLMGGDAGKITKEQKHFVERIYQGTDRMISLVNLLLQIARVEAGRIKIEPVPVDLKNTTRGVLVAFKADIDKKSQKVIIKSEPEEFPSIPMDQEVIWQVIQNLLSNANRYSPPKSTITISIIKKADAIEYSVKDEGIGIPKDRQDRIFEKFFRAENALKLVPTGSGLGLSLVKSLVDGWGGKIWFESEENKGTTFHFTVPISGMKPKKGEIGISV